MAFSYKRSVRVGELIFQTVSEILREIREFNVGLVTVMGVKLTDDLRSCRVFYSVLGTEEDKKRVKEILDANTKAVRHQLALRLNLRRTPTLAFVYDNTNEKAAKVFDILKKIEEEKEPSNNEEN